MMDFLFVSLLLLVVSRCMLCYSVLVMGSREKKRDIEDGVCSCGMMGGRHNYA